MFLDVFLGGTAESPARPACYSSALKLDGARNNGTRPRRHKNSRSGLGRSEGRNRAPCHRRHLTRYCGVLIGEIPPPTPMSKTRLPNATDLCGMKEFGEGQMRNN